jgi:hypothetical protein
MSQSQLSTLLTWSLLFLGQCRSRERVRPFFSVPQSLQYEQLRRGPNMPGASQYCDSASTCGPVSLLDCHCSRFPEPGGESWLSVVIATRNPVDLPGPAPKYARQTCRMARAT